MSVPAYDRIGIGYSDVRRPDSRIAARIEAALGDARTVLNVGAGTGSYEPLLDPQEIDEGLSALRADLESGRWNELYGRLRSAPEIDVGLRLVVAELRGLTLRDSVPRNDIEHIA